jgi:hypothetical protein
MTGPLLGHGQYLDKNGMFRPIEDQTSIRLDNLEAESRRTTDALATLNDILLTEGRILDILVNTLADLEKGEKK